MLFRFFMGFFGGGAPCRRRVLSLRRLWPAGDLPQSREPGRGCSPGGPAALRSGCPERSTQVGWGTRWGTAACAGAGGGKEHGGKEWEARSSWQKWFFADPSALRCLVPRRGDGDELSVTPRDNKASSGWRWGGEALAGVEPGEGGRRVFLSVFVYFFFFSSIPK